MKLPLLTSLTLLSVVLAKPALAELPILKGIGGEFSMQSSTGKVVNLSDFRSKVVLMFFGYTNCADICPTTMAHVSQLMQRLPQSQRQRVQVLFVSIDSDNDTPEQLNRYLSYFDPSFIGLVDSRANLDAVAALFHADYSKLADAKVTTEYKKLNLDAKGTAAKGYLYSHSAKIFVLDTQGRVRGFFYTGTPLDEMQQEIVSLLGSTPS